jgi:hypothetical protein
MARNPADKAKYAPNRPFAQAPGGLAAMKTIAKPGKFASPGLKQHAAPSGSRRARFLPFIHYLGQQTGQVRIAFAR